MGDASGQAPHLMQHLKSHPLLEPLLRRVERLERAGVVVALGGSGLLAALGLADTAQDWDLTTDAPLHAVLDALEGEPWTHHGPDDLHADQKLGLDHGAIEIIIGFAFQVRGGVVHIPTEVTGRWNGLPLGSPEGWAVAYALLGRPGKSQALLDHLTGLGASGARIARLRREPLPATLDLRLAGLPTSSDA